MIKNYTTTISASKSIAEIIDFLIDVNAQSINQNINANKQIESLTFTIAHNGSTIFYNLEAKPDGAYQYIIATKKRINEEVENKAKEQSYKVAWRILRDWVYAQCALIKLAQATPLQAFLPYVYDLEQQKSLYQKINDGDIKLLK